MTQAPSQNAYDWNVGQQIGCKGKSWLKNWFFFRLIIENTKSHGFQIWSSYLSQTYYTNIENTSILKRNFEVLRLSCCHWVHGEHYLIVVYAFLRFSSRTSKLITRITLCINFYTELLYEKWFLYRSTRWPVEVEARVLWLEARLKVVLLQKLPQYQPQASPSQCVTHQAGTNM